MAVDQNSDAELAPGGVQQRRKRAMKGFVQPVDALERDCKRQAVTIDVLAVSDDPSDCTEPADNPHRLGIRIGWHRLAKELWIQLVRLSVDVKISPRKTRRDQWNSELRHARKEVVDITIFGLAQAMGVETR
jgi:hypothetical protein